MLAQAWISYFSERVRFALAWCHGYGGYFIYCCRVNDSLPFLLPCIIGGRPALRREREWEKRRGTQTDPPFAVLRTMHGQRVVECLRQATYDSPPPLDNAL